MPASALPASLALPLVVSVRLTAAAMGAKRAQLVALVAVGQGAIPRAHEALAGAARELQLARLHSSEPWTFSSRSQAFRRSTV